MRLGFAAGLIAAAFACAHHAHAQPAVALPQLRSPPLESEQAARGPKRLIRFLTSADYPPFQLVAADGNPAGFNVDVARAVCASLEFSCTIQALPWDDLLGALESGRADALIAAMRPTSELRAKADLTRPYFRLPARFVAPKATALQATSPHALAGKRIAVIGGSAHEAYLRAFFAEADILGFPEAESAREAVKNGKADALFGDGAALALWMGGTGSGNCCAFIGEAFTESRFFGEGLTIAVRKGDAALLRVLDTALDDIEDEGTLADLYLRWFPLGIF